MIRPRVLPAFTGEERARVHRLLAGRVAAMMGRKLEEGDWQYVYCRAKGIPIQGWSNLNIDVSYAGLGVEHKMLALRAGTRMRDICGTRLMHPAATRSIRIPNDEDPETVKTEVLRQYADLIRRRRERVAAAAAGREPDLRTGWLLWEPTLHEFLYFEEEMLPPDPSDFKAEWRETGGGERKASRSLWVYERDTGSNGIRLLPPLGPKSSLILTCQLLTMRDSIFSRSRRGNRRGFGQDLDH